MVLMSTCLKIQSNMEFRKLIKLAKSTKINKKKIQYKNILLKLKPFLSFRC